MLKDALRLIRVFHDLSQKDLAQKLDISKSYLSEVESGKKNPTIDLLNRYSDIFNIPMSSIMFFSERLDSGTNGKIESARNFLSSKIISILDFIASRSEDTYAE
jgi:transcriptional regulator with XRE-family HTH domain